MIWHSTSAISQSELSEPTCGIIYDAWFFTTVSKIQIPLPANLRVQFGVGVGLTPPNADLHDAVHILLDELVVVEYLHGFAGALRSMPLKRTHQRQPQVVQVVDVYRLSAAHRPAGAKQTPEWDSASEWKVKDSGSWDTHFKLMCEASSWTMRECLLVEEFLPSQLGKVGNWLM